MSIVSLNIDSLYIIALFAVLLSIGLFFLSGFTLVKKGQTIVVEKLGVYYGTYQSGIHYFKPFIYRRVGLYKNFYEHEFTYLGKVIKIIIKLDNFEKYHYNPKSYLDVINDLILLDFKTINSLIEALQIQLNEIGCSLTK